MKTQTLQAVKAMTQNKNLINAATAVFQALAYEQTVREVINPKKHELVDFHKFRISPDFKGLEMGEFITRHEDMYLAAEQDFTLYLNEMDAFHREKGFEKPSSNHCPLLMAESLTRELKAAFVELLEPYTGLSPQDLMCHFDLRKKYIDLNLSLFSPLVKID